MNIEYLHASKFGNGAMVAEEFKQQMVARGVAVSVHHIREIKPEELPSADLYVFSSPGRMGRPTREMRRFLKDVTLPAGTKYALLTTEMAPRPDKKTGRMPTEEEICKFQHVRPIMNETLQRKGLVRVAEDKVFVTGIKGPLDEGWRGKVAAFAGLIHQDLAGREREYVTPRSTHLASWCFWRTCSASKRSQPSIARPRMTIGSALVEEPACPTPAGLTRKRIPP